MKMKAFAYTAMLIMVALLLQACGGTTPTAVPTAAGSKVAPLPAAVTVKGSTDLKGAANAGEPTPISCGETTDEALIAQVIVLVNAERAKVGAPPLTENPKLKAAATVHNNNMACLNFFDHTGQDGSQPDERVTAQNYAWANTGENIAAGQATAEDVMNSWMNSEGHKANILNPDFTEIGVAYASKDGSEWGKYWTQVFGRPQ